MTVSIANLRSTWTNNTVDYTGLGLNVNATSYDSNSKIFKLSINNNHRLYLTPNGDLYVYGGLLANGILGTSGNVLKSNGTSLYWSTPEPGVNTDAQYIFANVITFSNTINVTSIYAGIGTGSAGEVLTANGSGGLYWAGVVANTGGTVTSVGSGNGLTGGPITGAGTLSVVANTGIVVNATGVYVNNAYINTISSNNATNLNGQPASYYTNASNITTGTLPYARIPANIINTTSTFTITGVYTYNANVILGSGLSSNGSFGSTGQVLTTNGTATYWSTISGTVTSVGSGNGLTGGPITTSGSLSVLANTGIVANSTGLFVNSAYINTISSNSSTYANSSITNTFTVGTSVYFVSNGNVGIGNNAPAHKLRVEGLSSFSGNVILGAGVSANGSFGSAGQILTSNGTSIYWSTVTGTGTVTSVGSGNGLTGGPITGAGTLSVLANTGIVANSTGLFVNSAYINTISSNSATYANSSVTNTFTVGTSVYFVSNGNVGIGTNSPSAKLDVTDTFSIAKANVVSQTLSNTTSTISWDTTSGQIATVTLSQNSTFNGPTNLKIGTYILNVIQDGVGGRTGNFSNTIFKFPGGAEPVLTTTAGAIDIIFFYSDGTNMYGSFLPDVK